MAYDLFVGKSSKAKDTPELVARIAFDDLPAISRLLTRMDSPFLHRVSNFFEDQLFGAEQIEVALDQLLPLLPLNLLDDERAVLHKLISALSFAKWRALGLYGVAD